MISETRVPSSSLKSGSPKDLVLRTRALFIWQWNVSVVFYLRERHLLCHEDRGCFWLGKEQACEIILLASVLHIYIEELRLFCSFTAFSALQVRAQGRLVGLVSRQDGLKRTLVCGNALALYKGNRMNIDAFELPGVSVPSNTLILLLNTAQFLLLDCASALAENTL